jgi:hypothetical protein
VFPIYASVGDRDGPADGFIAYVQQLYDLAGARRTAATSAAGPVT